MSNIFQKPPQNYQYIVGFVNKVDFEDVTVTLSNNLAAPTLLQDVIFPANTFVQSGQRGYILGLGNATNPTAVYTLGITANGTSIYTINKGTNAANLIWQVEINLLRRGTNLLIVTSSYIGIPNSATSVAQTPSAGRVQLTPAFDADITIAFTAQGGGAGDTISQDSAWSSIG